MKTVSSIAWVQLALVCRYGPSFIAASTIRITGWNGTNANIVWLSGGKLIHFKLVAKLDTSLLQDRRSEKSSEGHSRKVLLLISRHFTLRYIFKMPKTSKTKHFEGTY